MMLPHPNFEGEKSTQTIEERDSSGIFQAGSKGGLDVSSRDNRAVGGGNAWKKGTLINKVSPGPETTQV